MTGVNIHVDFVMMQCTKNKNLTPLRINNTYGGDATLLSASAAALLRAPRFFSTTTTGFAADAATPRGYWSVAPLSRGS